MLEIVHFQEHLKTHTVGMIPETRLELPVRDAKLPAAPESRFAFCSSHNSTEGQLEVTAVIVTALWKSRAGID